MDVRKINFSGLTLQNEYVIYGFNYKNNLLPIVLLF